MPATGDELKVCFLLKVQFSKQYFFGCKTRRCICDCFTFDPYETPLCNREATRDIKYPKRLAYTTSPLTLWSCQLLHEFRWTLSEADSIRLSDSVKWLTLSDIYTAGIFLNEISET